MEKTQELFRTKNLNQKSNKDIKTFYFNLCKAEHDLRSPRALQRLAPLAVETNLIGPLEELPNTVCHI